MLSKWVFKEKLLRDKIIICSKVGYKKWKIKNIIIEWVREKKTHRNITKNSEAL